MKISIHEISLRYYFLFQIHVVDEERQYALWTNNEDLVDNIQFVNLKTGIIAAKKALNDLHYTLGQKQF